MFCSNTKPIAGIDSFADQAHSELRANAVLANSGLASNFVNISNAEAAALAHRHYRLEGTLTRFATEKDDTFRLQISDGTGFILKIANPDEDPAEIGLQISLLKHLEHTAPTLPVPRIMADCTGNPLPIVHDQAGQVRHMRLMSYLPGTVLDSTQTKSHEREKVGEVLAQLRLATASFAHPHAKRPLAWDVQNLLALAPLLQYVQYAPHRQQLEQVLQRHADLAMPMAALRKQVLHNDFSQSNIVVDHHNPKFVTGIIDFGDAVHTAIAIDVATALLNQLPRTSSGLANEDLFAHGRDLLRGYLQVADLQPQELELIPHLVMARVAARALLTHWRASFMPHNATYILRNTEPGWAQLRWFLAQTPKALSRQLLDF